MNTTNASSINEDRELISVARIDAQDESYILPIREYLETHGMDVVVNRESGVVPLYHIVAGDASFVKHIFFRKHEQGTKRLGIILGGGKVQEEFSGNGKLILADPTPMTMAQVMETFEFFFTEGKKHLDLRTKGETRTVHEAGIEVSPDEQGRADHARVSSIIADVFKEETMAGGRQTQQKKSRRRKRLRAWALGILMGIGLLVIPTVWYGLSVVIGGAAIASGAQSLRQGASDAVRWNTRLADYWIHQGAFVLRVVSVPFSWLGWEDSLRGQERLMSFMKDALAAEVEAQDLTVLAGRVAAGLLNQVDATSTGTTAASDISLLRMSLYTLGNTLGLAQSELQMLLADRTFPFSIGTLSASGMQAERDLADVRRSAGDIDKLMSLFISLAGFKEPRTYLILLQNSMELRPTGGFIGSVAIASFADGRLTNLDVQDVYTFDGQLKGHVDPPTPIKELLGQEHWYLRDSNWDPDFKEAGARAAWFYEKETGTTVDGVIGISTPFITELLRATGPIELPDYQDRITADNFYGKSIYYTQNDFFPGSTQKKDFLGSLSRTLLSTITTGANVNTAKLFRAITTALAGHDLMMMFTQTDIESLVEHYGWAGRVPPEAGCAGTNASFCVFDPLTVVEANLGVNKVNYFVDRSLERAITVHEDGTRTESATITIHNRASSQEQSLPYRAYIRFVLPPGSSVGEITLDGEGIRTRAGTKQPTVPYAETSSLTSGQFAVGIALDVPALAEKKLTVTYLSDRPFPFGVGGALLDVMMQKQAGVTGEKMRTVIRYPAGWTAGIEDAQSTGSARDFIAKPGQLEYNTILTRDDLTRIRFTKP